MRFSHRFLTVIAAVLLVGAAHAVERPVGPLTVEAALADAHRLAHRHGGARVARVEGDSMLPFFDSGSVLVLKPVSPERLRPGMVVLYRNRFGETIAHRIERRDEAGWVVRGYNNDAEDSTRVDASNLLGVVYATFYSSGRTADPDGLTVLLNNTLLALAAPAR